jgi:hypothetical protein
VNLYLKRTVIAENRDAAALVASIQTQEKHYSSLAQSVPNPGYLLVHAGFVRGAQVKSLAKGGEVASARVAMPRYLTESNFTAKMACGNL